MHQSFEPPPGGRDSAARIAALRARLADLGVDGMLVPRADAHQGETVAPSDERLAWLTGFSGSAGLAAVLADRAALFVDGRYTLQAAAQADTDVVDIVATHETKAADWLGTALAMDQTIGFDPWLHGRAEIARLAKAATGAGARLAPLESNPIDALWTDRPPRPAFPVIAHSAKLAGETTPAKLSRLGSQLGAAELDAAVLTLPDSIAWALNIRGADLAHVPVPLCFAILRRDATLDLFIASDRVPREVRETFGNHVTLHPPESFESMLAGLGGARVRLDEQSCPIRVSDILSQAGATLDWGADPCLLPKARKSASEIAGMTAAHVRDGAAMVRFLHWLHGLAEAGETTDEIAVASRLEAFREETGALRDISFDTICGAGPNGAIVHYRVNRDTNRTLAPGEMLLVDSGGQYEDGTTDITRTVAFGPVPEAARRPYTLVLKGLIAISSARFPSGLTGRDIDGFARRALWAAGFDYDHGTGHGVGAYLNVHEGPAGISRRSDKVALAPGMVISNEPGHYRPGAFGIRLENLVTVTEPAVPDGGEREMLGFRDLTLCPFDTRMVVRDLLTAEETLWLDRYHALVGETLAPHLPDDARAWLAERTASIG